MEEDKDEITNVNEISNQEQIDNFVNNRKLIKIITIIVLLISIVR